MADDSNGQISLDTGRFLWQSNNEVVNETLFSDRCAQLNGNKDACVDCRDHKLHEFRYAYPYISSCAEDGDQGCEYDGCGNRIEDNRWQAMSR